MTANHPNQPAFLDQLTKVTTGADHGNADVVTDKDAVGEALGALADRIPAGQARSGPSLGDKLKQIGITAEDRARAEAADKQARKERERAKEVATVRAFFNAAWAQFHSNIAAGHLPGSLRLGRRSHDTAATLLGTYSWVLNYGDRWQKGGKGIWNQPSSFKRMWEEFLQVCLENGLSPVWTSEHDGVGIESWWMLTVEALEEAPVVVDAAMGGIMDEIGAKLTRGGLEDASGARRLIRDALSQGNFAMAARMLGSDETWARALWNRHRGPAPSAAQSISDMEETQAAGEVALACGAVSADTGSNPGVKLVAAKQEVKHKAAKRTS